MFKRRGTTHKTNYTGVNHTALPGQEPSNSARAAALTIGGASKIGNASNGSSNQQRRASSIQPPHSSFGSPMAHTEPRSSSLLKRSSSITTKPNQGSLFSNFESTGPSPVATRRRSIASHSDSLNHQNMADLHLAHKNASDPVSPVKMVKKYVPTANGIQIIEVPESTMKQEIARSNSMRSTPRTSSLRRSTSTSFNSNKPSSRSSSLRGKQPSRVGAGSRLSSLVESPKLKTIAEPSTSSNSTSSPIDDEFKKLDEEIERERTHVKELEKRRKEFEKLKLQRQLEEEKLKSLEIESSNNQQNGTHETESESEEKAPLKINKSEALSDVTFDPVPDVINEEVEQVTPQASGNELQINDFVDLPNVSGNSSVLSTNFEEIPAKEVSDDSTLNAISASQVINVDEFDKIHQNDNTPTKSTDAEVYENEDHSSDGLAKQLRPKFDNSTVTIPEELLQIPKVTEKVGSSSSSIISGTSSVYSPSKKPMKSAMKKKSKSSLKSSKTSSNPANSAYLSLTTAENTRLNSKLSSSALDEVYQNHVIQAPSPINNSSSNKSSPQAAKRLSLRQPPSNAPVRSLRPQSMAAENHSTSASKGMSNRMLRNSYVAPIPVHPMLQEGYQSPGKTKAADLYAKANARPRSTFKQKQEPTRILTLRKDESNNVASQHTGFQKGNGTKPLNVATPEVANKPTTNEPAIQSRFADSDDEDHKQPNFASRFADSDDEGNGNNFVESNSAPLSPQDPHIISLRKPKEKEEPKQKKKFGKLRKLFGKS